MFSAPFESQSLASLARGATILRFAWRPARRPLSPQSLPQSRSRQTRRRRRRAFLVRTPANGMNSSSSSTTAAKPGSWATRGISMGTRETAQPEVASESWWEVIQGARGAGVLAPGASGWGKGPAAPGKNNEASQASRRGCRSAQCNVNLCWEINSERRKFSQYPSPSRPHHTPTTTVVSISRPKTWSRRAHSTRSLGPASPRSRCQRSLPCHLK